MQGGLSELHAVGPQHKADNHAHLLCMMHMVVSVAAFTAQATCVVCAAPSILQVWLAGVQHFAVHQQLYGVVHSHSADRDVKASCCYVSGNKNPGRVCLEPIQSLEALPLLHGSMQGYSRQPKQLQQGCYPPHCTDGIHKDQGAAWMLCKDVIQELITLSITALQAGLLDLQSIKKSGFCKFISAESWISARN